MQNRDNLLTFDQIYQSFVFHQNVYENQLSLINKNKIDVAIIPKHLIGSRPEDIENYFIHLINELNHSHSFNLVALTEAKLRIDYFNRVRARKKDPLSKYFRGLHVSNGVNISLEEHILDAWKIYNPSVKPLFSGLKSILKYRHWIAHGRSWTPKWGRNYEFIDIYFVCKNIESIIMTNQFQ